MNIDEQALAFMGVCGSLNEAHDAQKRAASCSAVAACTAWRFGKLTAYFAIGLEARRTTYAYTWSVSNDPQIRFTQHVSSKGSTSTKRQHPSNTN